MTIDRKDLAYLGLISALTLSLTVNVTYNTTTINNISEEITNLQNQTAQLQENATIIANQTFERLDNITDQLPPTIEF